MPLRPTPSPLYCWPSLPLPLTVDALSVMPTDWAISWRPERELFTRRECVIVTAVAAFDLHARARAVGHRVPVQHDARGAVDPDRLRRGGEHRDAAQHEVVDADEHGADRPAGAVIVTAPSAAYTMGASGVPDTVGRNCAA